MSKLNTRPSPNPKEDSPAFLRSAIHPSRDANLGTPDTVKRKRNFDVVDAQALYAIYPQFFKLVSDYAKIRQAIKLGLPMPGVKFDSVEVANF